MDRNSRNLSTPAWNRRELLAGSALAGLGLLSSASRAEALPHVHERGHQHGTDTSPKHPALVDAALDCVKTGQACLDHCLRVLKTGDTSLADCAVAVDELAATCLALSRLAALDSQHLPAFASVASKICAACEAECRKHAEHHAACATCAESCRECIAECKKVMA